jgi:NAD(P)-dependent dehydrogenase (short-subunit alcohol dehydrogenase family)
MSKKTVLITGCSSGIGKLVAKTFHDRGWNVVATMRSPEKETELTGLDDVLVTRLDVADRESIRQGVDAALDRFGALDVVVNNAGVGGHALLEQSSDEMTRALYETNVFGPMNVCRAVIPHMRERGRGCIINVTSMAGWIGLPLETTYCGTKHAMEGMTEALYLELKPLGIQAKTVAPGAYLRTSFSENADDAACETGDELAAYATKLRAHFRQSVSSEGGDTADPQEVADKIFECATTDTPVHNPVGADAQLIVSMIGAPPRDEYLAKAEPLLLPSA